MKVHCRMQKVSSVPGIWATVLYVRDAGNVTGVSAILTSHPSRNSSGKALCTRKNRSCKQQRVGKMQWARVVIVDNNLGLITCRKS